MPHIHEMYDFVISVIIVHEGRVLLVNHPRYDKWLPPGGHIELDEDPEQALYREIKEETGLPVRVLSSKPSIDSPGTTFLLTPNYLDAHDANAPHKHIGLIYFAVAENDHAILSGEHREMRWVPQADLASPDYALSPALQLYANEALTLAEAKP